MGVPDSITGQVSISFVGGVFGKLFEYLVYLALARSFGAGAVGAFSFGFVFLSLSTTIAKLGLDKAARKYVPIHSRDDSKLAGVLIVCLGGAFVAGCVASVVIYLSSDLIVRLTDESFGRATFMFLLGVPFMAVMTVGRAATTGFLTTRYAVYIKDFGQSGSALLFVVIAGYVSGTVRGAILGYVLSLTIGSFLALFFLVRQGGFSGISRPEFKTREIFVYSLPLTLAAAAQYLTNWTDILMLGAFVQPDAVGTYQVSYQTAMVLGFVLTAVGMIFPSVASDLYSAGDKQRLQRLYSGITKWVLYISAFGYLFLFFYGERILSIFGPEFTAGRPLLLIIGISIVLSTAVGPAGFLLMMTDYERVEMANTFIASLVNVLLNYLLIQQYGILGAAIATGFSSVLLNAFRLFETWHFLEMRPEIHRYWKGATAIGISGFAMYAGHYVPLPNIPLLGVVGLCSFCIFTVVLYSLGIDSEDRLLIESIQ